jgi:hypothetical protein
MSTTDNVEFNPLDHPVCLTLPWRTEVTSAWTLHTPLAMLLMDLARPSVFVELGSQHGVSYCAFCQAVQMLSLDCRCFAVDTWMGDEHAGAYGADVLHDLKLHHDGLYASFSTLIQSTFDNALDKFSAGSIDLLHVDGYHTYEVAKHDTETWLPKMSSRGVMVLHDISEYAGDFGVWQVWSELKERFPHHFEVAHGHGLGVIVVGDEVPARLESLLRLPEDTLQVARQLLLDLGLRVAAQTQVSHLQMELARMRQAAERMRQAAERMREEANEAVERQNTYQAQIQELQDEAIAIARRESEKSYRVAKEYQEATQASQRQIADLDDRLAVAQWQVSWLESSRGVRAVKLARAARTVFEHKGAWACALRVSQWLMGRRGYSLRDIRTTPSTPSSPSLSMVDERTSDD